MTLYSARLFCRFRSRLVAENCSDRTMFERRSKRRVEHFHRRIFCVDAHVSEGNDTHKIDGYFIRVDVVGFVGNEQPLLIVAGLHTCVGV